MLNLHKYAIILVRIRLTAVRISACGAQKYSLRDLRFEYGVILNGSQTTDFLSYFVSVFEYGVILNGSQTNFMRFNTIGTFEYGVILNGSQTRHSNDGRFVVFEYGVILNGSQTLPYLYRI